MHSCEYLIAQLLRLAPSLSTQASILFQATTRLVQQTLCIQSTSEKINAVTTKAFVDGHETEAVIDSAAAISIISENLARLLQGRINRNKIQRLRGVNNATETKNRIYGPV